MASIRFYTPNQQLPPYFQNVRFRYVRKTAIGDLYKYNSSPRLIHMKKTAYAKARSRTEDPSFLREAAKDGDLNIDGPTKTSALFDIPSRR